LGIFTALLIIINIFYHYDVKSSISYQRTSYTLSRKNGYALIYCFYFSHFISFVEKIIHLLYIYSQGAGKSTLGNLMLGTSENETPTFFVSDSFVNIRSYIEYTIMLVTAYSFIFIF
jgi:hypothetical protein